jgi:hypothetical protein
MEVGEKVMIAKSILMFGQPCILACDAKCHKAWGINNRPQIYLDDPTQTIRGYGYEAERSPDFENGQGDYDNTVDLADDELGNAPEDPGTGEGGHGKPRTSEERLNKWCARECERSVTIDDKDIVEDFELPDYNQRRYNIAPHTRPTETIAQGEKNDPR